MDYDRTAMPAAYDAGRSYAPAVLEFWLDTIAAALPAGARVSHILDLGCGTGRYSTALARRFGARVTAADPSEKMLAEARGKAAEGVEFRLGPAEAIPLPDGGVDMVFISMAFHHFADPAQAARECHRVLRAGGVVCLRAGATDRAGEYAYVPFFPRTPELLARSLTSLAFIEATFAAAGVRRIHHEAVPSPVAATWPEYADKIAHRADSILAQLTDAEFEEGHERLRTHAMRAKPGEPVIEPVDFFVFQRG